MGIEIERKFLLKTSNWRNAVKQTISMAQGYLNSMAALSSGDQNASVRVRTEGEQAFLNIKSNTQGLRRQEFDYEIPLDDARALLELCVGHRVIKQRHLVEHAGNIWEIDEFAEENAGLIVAELELASEDATFEKPEWLGAEVTQSRQYYNLALAAHPYLQWTEAERHSVHDHGN